jgi:hypothetical protein
VVFATLARESRVVEDGGSPQAGLATGLVVLNRNLSQLDPTGIRSARVELPLLDGTVLFERAATR